MQNVYFYLPKGSLFEATEYYVNLIAASFSPQEYKVFFVDHLQGVTANDFLVTIRPYDAAHLKFTPKKHIHWFQGIAPEERVLLDKSLKARFYSYLYKKWEKIALVQCDVAFFVSHRMLLHYESKYKLDLIAKSIIMPCYNIRFDITSFDDEERYTSNSFVYAGGLNDWQCIKETLLIFKGIVNSDKTASLVLLTKDKELADKYISDLQVPNVKIDFVPLNQLQQELKKYKFGFLLRRNHIINNVSTPTKMNSYLAAGVIPIYTPYIDAFEENINLKDYCIKLDNIDDVVNSVEKIQSFNKNLDLTGLKETYMATFNDFYNDSKYINQIQLRLTNLK